MKLLRQINYTFVVIGSYDYYKPEVESWMTVKRAVEINTPYRVLGEAERASLVTAWEVAVLKKNITSMNLVVEAIFGPYIKPFELKGAIE